MGNEPENTSDAAVIENDDRNGFSDEAASPAASTEVTEDAPASAE